MGARSALHLNDLLWVAVSLPDPNPLKATNPTANLLTSAPGVAPRARQLECVLCPTLFRWFAATIDAVRLMRELRAARCISEVKRTRHHYKTAGCIETEKRHLCTPNLEQDKLNSTLLITGRRISREGGKAEGFDGRCRLDPRGCAALRAAQAADAIRRPVVAGAKRPRQQVIIRFPPIYQNLPWLKRII